jgi:hypothetical protein
MNGRAGCLDEETILAFIDGTLTTSRVTGLEQHVRDCRVCDERLSAGFAAAPPPAAAEGASVLARGTSIGRYTVRTQVGQGGMGEVYAAHDPELDRTVALKLLRSRGAALPSTGERRLMREAQAVARLSHPNVITVYDVGTHQGRVFLAMEYVEGQTLSSWLAEQPRGQAEIIGLFRDAARGLAAAHAAGLVHRDFKPQNVMVGEDGVVRVTDFGLARRIDADALTESGATVVSGLASHPVDLTLTKSGELVGTPLYMAPEQLRGGPIGPRGDQFSFCVALYEALYGEHPFLSPEPPREGRATDGTDRLDELLRTMAMGKLRPPPPNSRVPLALRRLLERGMSVNPKVRFPAMDDLIAALSPDAPRRRRLAPVAAAALLGAVVAAIGLAERSWLATARPAAPAISPPAVAAIPAVAPSMTRLTTTIAPPAAPAPSPHRAHRSSASGPTAKGLGGAAPAELVSELLRPAEDQLGQGRIAEACALGRIASERAPRSSTVWEFLGRCYMRMSEPEDAIASYRKALALAPNGPRAPFIRAIVDRSSQ